MEECSFFDQTYDEQSSLRESNEFITVKLIDLEKEIDKLPDNISEAYYVALGQEIKQETSYVRSKTFLIAFLRAEKFDTPKAAMRLAKFFMYKIDLFGAERLPHQIRKDDLNDDDSKILNSGFINQCGSDCGGRLVYFFQRERLSALGLFNDKYMKNISRVAFYHLMSSIECNEVCQKNGFVGIRWDRNCTHSLNDYRIMALSVAKVFAEALPLKFAAFHICSDSPSIKTMLNVASAIFPAWIVRKIKGTINFQVDSSAEGCLSELSKFGINIEFLPITMNGKIKEESAQLSIEPIPQKCTNGNKMHFINHTSAQKSGNKTLPENLRKVLDDKSLSKVIWWVCNGKAFAVNKNNLLCDVLKKDFRGIRKSSFFRALKRWGFQRLRDEESHIGNVFVFKHALFQENLPLCPDHFKIVDDSEQVTSPKFKFMKKLHKILETEKAQHAIWWEENDDAFAINRDKFIMDVLPEDYNGIQFSSFRRSLQRWGFKHVKADGDILVFQHPSFHKDWLDPFVK